MATSFLEEIPNTRLATIVASPSSAFRQRILKQLALRNCLVEEVCGGAEALARVEEGICRTLVLDQSLADLNVEELVAIVHARHPQVNVQVLESQAEDDSASGDMDLPTDSDKLFHLLQHSREVRIPQELPPPLAPAALRTPAPSIEIDPLPGMTGCSPSMLRVYRLVRLVAGMSDHGAADRRNGDGQGINCARASRPESPA